jgi:membrane fusion protein
MTASRLFRQEAISAQSSNWIGSILLVSKNLTGMLVAASVVSVLLVIFFLTSFEYTRRARVSGSTAPDQGLIKVLAPISGVVLNRDVSEGEHLTQGRELLSLSGDRATQHNALAQAEVSEKVRSRIESLQSEKTTQLELMRLQRSGLQQRQRSLEGELAQLGREAMLQTERVSLSQKSVERFKELVRTQFASQTQAQQREEELLDQQARLQALHRSRIGVEKDLFAVRSELSQLPTKLDSQVAAIDRSLSSAEQELLENESRRQVSVTAQQAGTATAVLVEAGQMVSAGQPLLSIVPTGSTLEAHLYAPSRSAGFIQPGHKVLLRYQAFPYQKFGHQEGIVKHVSKTALAPQELSQLAQGSLSSNEPVFKIVVELDSQTITAYGEQKYIQPGMQLEADILLDRRRLVEWILEPLYSLRGKV